MIKVNEIKFLKEGTNLTAFMDINGKTFKRSWTESEDGRDDFDKLLKNIRLLTNKAVSYYEDREIAAEVVNYLSDMFTGEK